MRGHRFSTAGLALCAIGLALGLIAVLQSGRQPAVAAQTYEVVPLGELKPGSRGIVRGLNLAGETVGGAHVDGRGHRAFKALRNNREIFDGLPGSDYSASLGINRHGAVVGFSNTATALRAFRRSRGVIEELRALPGDRTSNAFGINSLGQATGYSGGPNGIQAVRWAADGSIEALGTLRPGDYSRGIAINDKNGEVVGTSGTSSRKRGFLWTRRDRMLDLGVLPGDTDSEAVGINNRSEIVGVSTSPLGNQAFVWTRAGGMQSLGTLRGHHSSEARAINELGQVVGSSRDSVGSRAFLWTGGVGMLDLNDLIPPGSGFVLREATGINDIGQIVVVAAHDQEHADHALGTRVFLLTPQ